MNVKLKAAKQQDFVSVQALKCLAAQSLRNQGTIAGIECKTK